MLQKKIIYLQTYKPLVCWKRKSPRISHGIRNCRPCTERACTNPPTPAGGALLHCVGIAEEVLIPPPARVLMTNITETVSCSPAWRMRARTQSRWMAYLWVAVRYLFGRMRRQTWACCTLCCSTPRAIGSIAYNPCIGVVSARLPNNSCCMALFLMKCTHRWAPPSRQNMHGDEDLQVWPERRERAATPTITWYATGKTAGQIIELLLAFVSSAVCDSPLVLSQSVCSCVCIERRVSLIAAHAWCTKAAAERASATRESFFLFVCQSAKRGATPTPRAAHPLLMTSPVCCRGDGDLFFEGLFEQ
jgi:hypothetical protein